MRKLGMLVLMLVLAHTGIHAQDVAKAKSLLEKMNAKYKKYSTLQASFKYIIETPASGSSKTSGSGILNLKKNMFTLDTKELEVYCDGKSIWTHQKEDESEATKDDYVASELAFNPATIFSVWQKGFLYAYMGDETLNGKTVSLVELTPQDKKQIYFKIKLYIDKATNTLSKTIMYQKNGDIYTYTITKQSPNIPMDDAMFSWDKSKHPGIEVMDVSKKK